MIRRKLRTSILFVEKLDRFGDPSGTVATCGVLGAEFAESQWMKAFALQGHLTPTYPAKTCSPVIDFRLRSARGLERMASALLLLVLSPAIVLAALLICGLSRRGPLIRHERVGWQGRPLAMLKLRTMWSHDERDSKFRIIEDVSGPPLDNDDREEKISSRFAAFCRRYSLDELPQLWHVARGEMSLVGPRPITASELEQYYGGCADEVLSARPGMTGLWQIRGRKKLSYSARRRFDLILVRRASPTLYFGILLRSLPCVIRGNGAY